MQTILMRSLISAAVVAIGAAAAPCLAADHVIDLTGNTADFSESQSDFNGKHYDRFDLPLNGIDSGNPVTVAQGDTISSTVTFDQAFTIPMSPDHTDVLQYFNGTDFPSTDTGVTGTFDFYDGATLVRSFDYRSSTSGQLSSYAALFGANDTAFTFDKLVNSLVITNLSQPSDIQFSTFTYAIVSDQPAAAPEPATWAMLIIGFGGVGAAMRGASARVRRQPLRRERLAAI